MKMGSARLYIPVAIVVKLILFIAFVQLRSPVAFQDAELYQLQGDSFEYIALVENLLEHGEYRTDEGAFAVRMPGYAPVYLFYRLALPQQFALNATLITQVVLSGISCYALALIAGVLFGSLRMFKLVFWTYAISTYVSIWALFLLTESFATSSMVIGTWFLVKAHRERRKKDVLIAGVMIGWCIFLRPFMLPVLGLYAWSILLVGGWPSWRERIVYTALFVAPFLVCDAAWLMRNRILLEEWIPLQSRVTYNDSGSFSDGTDLRTSVCDLTRTLGIDHAWWNEREATYWFLNADATLYDREELEPLLTNGRTFKDIEELRAACVALEQTGDTSLAVQGKKQVVIAELQDLHDDYKAAHPWHYQVTARLRHLQRFMLHTGVYNLPFPRYEDQNMLQRSIKVFYAALYFFAMVFGAIVCVILMIRSFSLRDIRTYVLAVPVYLMLFFPFVLKMHEFRFNTLCYPVFMMCACYALDLAVRSARSWSIPGRPA